MNRPFLRVLCVATIGFLMASLPVVSQQALHDEAQKSLVQLFASGTPKTGPLASVEGGAKSQGTGFFVGRDGYILTTEHFFNPLKKVDAVNTKITASFVGTGTGQAEVQFVSKLSELDLVLLKAVIPFGIETPPSLEIGSTADVDLADPALLTSGFDTSGYRRKELEFNSTATTLVPYAWTMNGKTNSGASGSPVYIDKGGKPLVVGLIKATARDDDEFTLMIPVEYSFHLIGQFKMQEIADRVAELAALKQQVADLQGVVKQISDVLNVPKPLGDRVVEVESSVDQIKKRFNWTAETNDKDGSIIVRYEKIISDGPQIDEIKVKIRPSIFIKDEETGEKVSTPTLTWKTIDRKRSSLTASRIGTFKIPGVRDKLTDAVLNADGSFQDQDPFSEISLTLSAMVEGVPIQKKLIVPPKYTWDFNVD